MAGASNRCPSASCHAHAPGTRTLHTPPHRTYVRAPRAAVAAGLTGLSPYLVRPCPRTSPSCRTTYNFVAPLVRQAAAGDAFKEHDVGWMLPAEWDTPALSAQFERKYRDLEVRVRGGAHAAARAGRAGGGVLWALPLGGARQRRWEGHSLGVGQASGGGREPAARGPLLLRLTVG